MKNIYNKGKYRSGEWGKHLRPFLKRYGNKRWRRNLNSYIEEELLDEKSNYSFKKGKKILKIRITTEKYGGGRLHTYKVKYRTQRAMMDSINRNQVLTAFLCTEDKLKRLK